jgi:hypothetical protein
MYRRLGFDSLQEFLESLEWDFAPEDGAMAFSGIGYHYQLRLPVVDPKTQRLYANFRPDPPVPGKREVARPLVMIPEDDLHFYGRADGEPSVKK